MQVNIRQHSRKKHAAGRFLGLAGFAIVACFYIATIGLPGLMNIGQSPVPKSEPLPAAVLQFQQFGIVQILGAATVIDGNTLEIYGQPIRLFGIDAPELNQTCISHGEIWRCGDAAAAALAKEVTGRTVGCAMREVERAVRRGAICYVGATDLNEQLVSHGWAVALLEDGGEYAAAARRADLAGLGIWASEFVTPAQWKRQNQ